MKSNFALRTLLLLTAWLVFENFNRSLPTDPSPNHGNALSTVQPCSSKHSHFHSKGCKSIESPALPSPAFFAPAAIPFPPYKIKTIVLDAGHGGKDPGCIGASAHEKDNTLAIVLRVGAYIEANCPGIKVIYTRDSDVFIELNERADIANRNNADLFISVHCNALSLKYAKGTETYVLGLHRSKDNLEVAKRENASIYLEDDYKKNYEGYDPNSAEAQIFASVWQSAYLEQSILLASYVQQFSSAVAFREDRGVKQAGFLVLRETAMPSVLIETGYLTNATEEEYLASEEGREQMALAIFQAFEAYKRHMETGKPIAVNTTPAPKTPAIAAAKPVVNKPSTGGKAQVSGEKPLPMTTVANKPAVLKPETVKPVAPSFTIFLLAWPNRLDPNVGQLSLLANVKEIRKEGKYHYFSGVYASRTEAEKVLPEIQNMGFKTASIVQN